MDNLKNWEYPLDGSLKLCKKYKRNEATAFLLERTGASDEAISMYFQVQKSLLKKKLKQKLNLDDKR